MQQAGSNRPNFDLLRDAFAIMDGIPSRVIDLDSWTTEQGKTLSCGTIACAGGWLARHPQFMELGLRIDSCGGVQGKNVYGIGALAELFNLDRSKGEEYLFNSDGDGYRDRELFQEQREQLGHKRLWKRRVLRLFQEYNEPFEKRLARGLMLDARRPIGF
jgi:hypothetical protein